MKFLTLLVTTTTTLVKPTLLALSLLLSSLLISTTVYANGNAAKGKALFSSSKCTQCHDIDPMFTKTGRKVKNLKDLEAAVRLNDSKLNTNWFDEDVKDVTAYLNQKYYKF